MSGDEMRWDGMGWDGTGWVRGGAFEGSRSFLDVHMWWP